jgi:hypothetical protein
MALVKCADCGKAVSDQAPACPICGRPMARNTQPQKMEDINATGFLGKPGTGYHALNLGCLVLLLGIVIVLLSVWYAGLR